MNKTFDAIKYGQRLKWETVEFEIQEDHVKILMLKKTKTDQLIYNELKIDKAEFFEFMAKAIKEDQK